MRNYRRLMRILMTIDTIWLNVDPFSAPAQIGPLRSATKVYRRFYLRNRPGRAHFLLYYDIVDCVCGTCYRSAHIGPLISATTLYHRWYSRIYMIRAGCFYVVTIRYYGPLEVGYTHVDDDWFDMMW